MASIRDWRQVQGELRHDWDTTVLGSRRPWDEVQDDIHFGWSQAMRPDFRGARFEDVESELQRLWEQRVPHARHEDWLSVREAVRAGFERGQEELDLAA
ncbi:MAG: hypothetical protein M1358_16580 [Chloroflexi bacterium]|nr:hypothetical protein [Chloroflexota bacterium]